MVGLRANVSMSSMKKVFRRSLRFGIPAFHPVMDSECSLSLISAKVCLPLLTAKYGDVIKHKQFRTRYTEKLAITSMHRECNPNAELDIPKTR